MKRFQLKWGKFLIWRVRSISNQNFILVLSVIVGVAAGLAALMLKTSVFYLHNLLVNEVNFNFQNYLLLIYPTIGITLTLLFRHYIIRDDVKHNIGSILYSISKKKSVIRLHKTFSSIVGSTLTAAFGGSIGLEAPIISSGSAIGSNLGRVLGQSYKSRTLLLGCGAAGGVAAIFNTPIAGIVFVIEVLLLDLTRFTIIPLLLSASSGAILTKVLFEEEILFDFQIIDNFQINDLPFYFLFAIVTGFVSLYFTRTYLFVDSQYQKIKKKRYKLLVGTLILGVLLFLFPPLFGEGFSTIKSVLAGNFKDVLNNSLYHSFQDNMLFIVLFFSLLCVLKVIATATTISIGGIGGIMAPSLFVGANSGFLFAYVMNLLPFSHHLSERNFALVGMASTLGGILQAPLTGVFLIAEVTGGYTLIAPLMFTTAIAYFTAKYFEPNSIFTKQLAQRGELITHHKDKAVLTFMQLKSVIEKDIKTIHVDATLGDLVKVISKSRRNIFPVLDDNKMLVGMIVLDDIREIMFDPPSYKKVMVKDLMFLPPTYISPDDNMELVMDKFQQTNAWNLPVIDDGKYVGFVSKSKMFSVYRRLLVDISDD